jgi:hypothetical protein
MFRRAKLWLGTIGEERIRQAIETGAVMEGRLGLTDGKGGPLCASVRPPVIQWSVTERGHLVAAGAERHRPSSNGPPGRRS